MSHFHNAYDIDSEAPALVLGGAGVDIVGRLDSQPIPKTSNPAQIRTSYGGVARNVAENLARLGQSVILISAVGEDQVGEQLIDHTSQAGVDCRCVMRTSEAPTGAYLAIVDNEGELQYAIDDMRSITALTPEAIRHHAELFKTASVLFLDGNLSEATIKTAMSLAKRAKIPICADPTSTSLATRFEPYLDRLALVTPNVNEGAILCGYELDAADHIGAREAAKHLVTHGVEFAIITLAEFGVCYATSETSGYVPAIKTEIIDPTGGGDALTAAVIFALLQDIPADEAIRLGVSAASLTLRHRGAVLPDLSLEKLYDQLVI